MSVPVAAVDCGSNSTRLLVLDASGTAIGRQLRITRLSAGVDASGRLDDEALQRTLDVLGEYRSLWEQSGVDGDVRIAATSAVRDASNREAFFDGVRRVTGVEAEVLTGDEEARLSFAGAVGALEVSLPAALVDIGGGSTELVVGDGIAVRAADSMQLGSVRLTERHLHDDPPTTDQVRAARRMIESASVRADAALAEQGTEVADANALIGVAGTVTTVAALHLDLPDELGVHGIRLLAADVRTWADRLLAMTTAQRRALPAVPAGREDVIHAGALILADVVERYGFAEVVVSEADILDGLAHTLLR